LPINVLNLSLKVIYFHLFSGWFKKQTQNAAAHFHIISTSKWKFAACKKNPEQIKVLVIKKQSSQTYIITLDFK